MTYILALLLGSFLYAEDAKLPSLETVLKTKWHALRLDVFNDVGDFDMSGPSIFIQRLPDKRLLLSYGKESHDAKSLPVARRYITDGEVEAIVAQALVIWEQAKSETSPRERLAKLPASDQAAIRAKAAFGTTERTIFIQLSVPDRRDDMVLKKTAEKSADEWTTLIMKAADVGP